MNIVVFGATGTTGREVVKQAIDLGYTVSVFARNPKKVTLAHPNLKVIQGDVLNVDDVHKAVKDQDAVLSSLGAGLKGTVRSKGTNNIITAMTKAGVHRLVSQSTLGVGDSVNNLNAYWRYFMFGFLLRGAYADHVLQEEFIRTSSLDWTIVRPGSLTDGVRTGNYQHGFSSNYREITLNISAADVAEFMLKQLTDKTYVRAAPSLSY